MDIESVTTWIDMSVLESELSGVLLVLLEVWLLVGLRTLALRSLEVRVGKCVGEVLQGLPLRRAKMWRPRIRVAGTLDTAAVRIEWRVAWGNESLVVRVDSDNGRRVWVGDVMTDSGVVLAKVRELLGEGVESTL